MAINGKPVTLTDSQRALSKQYYAASKQIAMHGLEIGKESAKLATQAIGSAIGGVISGENEADIEKKIEAKAGNIEAVAQKLCDSAMELKAIQEQLAAAVPEFTPEPMEVVSQDDGCSVNSGNANQRKHGQRQGADRRRSRQGGCVQQISRMPGSAIKTPACRGFLCLRAKIQPDRRFIT